MRETAETLARRIRVARGEEPADLLFVNGSVVSTFTSEILATEVAVAGRRIAALGGLREAREVVDLNGACLAPAFTDAHIHVESSMLTPEGFAEAVVPHGTGLCVSDPHEIANVLGLEGLEYMSRAAEGLPMDILFTVPSCVPATSMETSGANLGPMEVSKAFSAMPEAPALSEMMNYPGVLFQAPDVLQKIAEAHEREVLIDGHSPGLSGSGLDAYISAGIATDHECLTAGEALEKLRRGMFVFMREGSAAKNFLDLLPALTPGNIHRVCIVSDDLHPDDILAHGHMDNVLRKGVANGLDPVALLRMVTLNPAAAYGLKWRGGIAPGYFADLVVLSDLREFRVREVYHHGARVAKNGELLAPIARKDAARTLSSVHLPAGLSARLRAYPQNGNVRVIGVNPSQITTRSEMADASAAGAGQQIQYAAVIERHGINGNVGLGFVSGFGLKGGALASTVSHDSHNLVIVGCSPEEMELAAKTVASMGGGLAAVQDGEVLAKLPLEVAGL
ncbi:MAG: adenine deaminase, partial [Acidobacteria bacterium]|nr:adenine deaminase [Acidobacteriota bacterium]